MASADIPRAAARSRRASMELALSRKEKLECT
jgi:hypothetical protein